MNQFFIPSDSFCPIDDHQWDGYTLILPCISVGNVPQLSIDLLINHLLVSTSTEKTKISSDLKFVGYIRSQHVHPFAGPDPYKYDGSLYSTSIQVFVSDSKKLVIIQQRSPIYKVKAFFLKSILLILKLNQEFRENFYAELTEWLSKHEFFSILILSSSFDQFLIPEFVSENFQSQIPIMYLAQQEFLNESMKNFLEKNLNLKPVPKVDQYTMKLSEDGKIHLPGSGSARSFIQKFSNLGVMKASNIVCLVMFCSEGDNRYHSFKFADKIIELLNFNNKNNSNDTIIIQRKNDSNDSSCLWSTPFSWRLMFGDEPPAEIF